MGRYIKDLELNQPIDTVSMIMDDFFYHNHFCRTDWNGEMVFGLEDERHVKWYMKWHYAEGIFHIEAWLQNAFGGEMDLDGVGGGSSRKEYRKKVDTLLDTLTRSGSFAGNLAGGHIGSDPLHHGEAEENHAAWEADTAVYEEPEAYEESKAYEEPEAYEESKDYEEPRAYEELKGRTGAGQNTFFDNPVFYAILAFVFGSFFAPAGVVLGIIGCTKMKGWADTKDKQALGRILCIFVIVIYSCQTLIQISSMALGIFMKQFWGFF